MTRTVRTRLTPDARRAQLLALGAELFSNAPFSQVSIEEIAERAGVSRGLLYRYFPTKRDFVVAMIAAEAQTLRELLVVDSSLPVDDQLRTCLERFLDFAAAHAQGFRAVYGASLAADDDVRRIVADNQRRDEDQILQVLITNGRLVDGDDEAIERMRMAVRGWLAYVVAVTLQWLEHDVASREQVLALCAATLRASIETVLPV